MWLDVVMLLRYLEEGFLVLLTEHVRELVFCLLTIAWSFKVSIIEVKRSVIFLLCLQNNQQWSENDDVSF